MDDCSAVEGDCSSFLLTALRGHKKPVTCLESDRCSVLISGSSDRTCRLWDLKSHKTFKCIYGCFDDEIEMVRLGSDTHAVYVQSGNAIQSFDMRYDGLLSKQPIASLRLNIDGDGISTIALNSRKNLLAIGMDSGNITLVHVDKAGEFCADSGGTRYRKLSRVHSNVLSTVLFRDDHQTELLSGGFDYTAAVWDIGRGRPKASLVFQPADPSSGCTMMNPPFVMGLEYCLDNKYIVAAVGDGTIRLLKSRDLQLMTSIAAHSCMITALSCNGRHVVTGGVDAKIHSFILEEAANDELTKEATTQSTPSANKALRSQKTTRVEEPPSLKRTFSISHTAKINSIVSLFQDSTMEGSPVDLFIADTTCDISLYSLKQ